MEKDKKLELLSLTLYRNLAISETMDLTDLLSKSVKTNEVNMLASPQKCKVTIKNKEPIDVVKIKHNLKNKKKKFNHPDEINSFCKTMTYYQYEQAVKNEEESKVETQEDAVDINKAFTERTGIVIPKSYK